MSFTVRPSLRRPAGAESTTAAGQSAFVCISFDPIFYATKYKHGLTARSNSECARYYGPFARAFIKKYLCPYRYHTIRGRNRTAETERNTEVDIICCWDDTMVRHIWHPLFRSLTTVVAVERPANRLCDI